MLVGLGQDRVYAGVTPTQANIDYVLDLYGKYGETRSPGAYWTQQHAGDITSGAKTREQIAAHFAEYFTARTSVSEAATTPSVNETVGVPSITQIVNGAGVTDFLTGEMIAGVPNWILLAGGVAALVMFSGKR